MFKPYDFKINHYSTDVPNQPLPPLIQLPPNCQSPNRPAWFTLCNTPGTQGRALIV